MVALVLLLGMGGCIWLAWADERLIVVVGVLLMLGGLSVGRLRYRILIQCRRLAPSRMALLIRLTPRSQLILGPDAVLVRGVRDVVVGEDRLRRRLCAGVGGDLLVGRGIETGR